jgi:serine/threonine protein kinase
MAILGMLFHSASFQPSACLTKSNNGTPGCWVTQRPACRPSGSTFTSAALKLMLDLLAALSALHDRGVTHRDISPNN